MLKTLKISVTALVLAATAATSAFARGEPWLEPRPEMTDAQLKSVQAAEAVRKKLPAGQFGYDPEERDWRWAHGVQKDVPLSNMHVSDLNALVKGKYRIMKQGKLLSVQYFSTNGLAYNCDIQNKKISGYPVRYAVMGTSFGLAGFNFSKDTSPNSLKGIGWNVVGDSKTGLLYQYVYDKSGLYSIPFLVQSEAPAYAVEICPDMPVAGKVNEAQVSPDFNDLLKHAKRITSFKVAFPNDPQNPATAGMLYNLYPPVRPTE